MELAQTEFRFQMGRFGYLRPLPIDPLAFLCGHALLEVVDFLVVFVTLHRPARLFILRTTIGFARAPSAILGIPCGQ
jgi:hypothetical protein